MTRSAKISSI